jgi:flagellar motor switch/type III secretory pathway protein FliN
LRILRTIDSFQPNRLEPAQQAWQISNRLEQKGIRSPLLTTASSSDDRSSQKETLDQVQITRVPIQFALGQYKVSFGMMTYLRRYHILHSHLYRTFQTDCAFFLR